MSFFTDPIKGNVSIFYPDGSTEVFRDVDFVTFANGFVGFTKKDGERIVTNLPTHVELKRFA